MNPCLYSTLRYDADMHRGPLEGAKFKLIRLAASFIQNLAKPHQSFLIRPVNRLQNESSDCVSVLEQVGIVIQGPVSSFLHAEELAAFVHQLTKVIDAKLLIVSTWDCEASRYFEKIAPCKVILNNDVGFANNFQRQLFSTSSGLTYLKSLGVDISIKLRIDQTLDPLAITLLSNIALGDRYSGRLIFSSMNSYTHRFFGLSDMLNAGTTDDMLEFWSPDILSQYFQTSTATIDLPFSSWVNDIKPHWFESFLCIRFAYSKGTKFSDSPWDDYMAFLSNWVVLVDAEIINQKWSKIKSPLYSLTERSLYNPSVAFDDSEMTQSIWFAISEGAYRAPQKDYDFDH